MGAFPSAPLKLQARECLFPEPTRQICYNTPRATPQNLNPKEVDFVARYLRAYQAEAVANGKFPFFRMPAETADGCAEWQVTAKGGTWVMAKLVGQQSAAVTFSDIANAINGLGLVASDEANTIVGGGEVSADDPRLASLFNCGTAGSQMGVIVNGTDPLYESEEFVHGGFTTGALLSNSFATPTSRDTYCGHCKRL